LFGADVVVQRHDCGDRDPRDAVEESGNQGGATEEFDAERNLRQSFVGCTVE
jgi:hypothetical protein